MYFNESAFMNDDEMSFDDFGEIESLLTEIASNEQKLWSVFDKGMFNVINKFIEISRRYHFKIMDHL